MSTPTLLVYERIIQQVDIVRNSAARELASGRMEEGAALLRSCIVFTVAALDAYMHEQAVRLLVRRAGRGVADASAVVQYLGHVTIDDVTGNSGASADSYIRYRLSYKTLVSPTNIDSMLTAADLSPDRVWLHVALALGSRPERVRNQTSLLYDRRNQIAHEGDWDIIDLSFRNIEPAHADDCYSAVNGLVNQMEVHLV